MSSLRSGIATLLKAVTLYLVVCSNQLLLVDAHGYMESPRSINYVANVDGTESSRPGVPRKEYCPHCLNRKRVQEVCGTSPSHNYDDYLDSTGRPMPWQSEATYNPGEVITIKSVITAHHWGHIEVSLCPDGLNPTPECFRNPRHRLEFVEDLLHGAPRNPSYPHYGHLAGREHSRFEMRFKLPDAISGNNIVLQWKYVTANSCAPPGYNTYPWPAGSNWWNPSLRQCTSFPEDGLGAPEQFWNCGRITIRGSGGGPTPPSGPPPPSPSPPSPTPPSPSPGPGFCNYGPDGTGDTSDCSGGAEGGEWCNRSSGNCALCSGRWCTSGGPSPTPPSPSPGPGFCNYGPDGTGATSDCSGGAEGGEWCNRSSGNCAMCSGRWCTSGGPSPAPPSPSPGPGFCNYGPDGTGATSDCSGGAEGGEWCNRSSGNCALCSGRWCTSFRKNRKKNRRNRKMLEGGKEE